MKSTTFLLLFFLFLLSSCRKDGYTDSADARLSLSNDHISFDTVFTTIGSVTRSFKIINENNQKLLLSSVKLGGGEASPFKINIDGSNTVAANDVTINANDSIYLFVQVKIDPQDDDLPFIVSDSIEIKYNGNTRKVMLEAWGQNAHFLREHVVNNDMTWENDKPYVILGYLHIAENKTLTIEKGCRIYAHADAPVVVDGSLKVNGGKDTADRVSFQGDRLDKPYKDYPAGWPGIYFRTTSRDNVFQYAVVKNALQAIALTGPSVNANPKLVLNETIIDNAFDAGIISENGSIRARNCLVSNCGRNIVLSKGGSYDFNHLTIASISNDFIDHKNPVLTITNHDAANATANLDLTIRNSIIWGDKGLVEDEIVVSKMGNTVFSVVLDHSIWKTSLPPANVTATNMLNAIPEFDSINTLKNYYNFRLKDISPAVNAGVASSSSTDLDGNIRPVGLPDMGCFEKQ